MIEASIKRSRDRERLAQLISPFRGLGLITPEQTKFVADMEMALGSNLDFWPTKEQLEFASSLLYSSRGSLLDGTPNPPESLSTEDRMKEHQKKAGRSGGLSRSDTKRKSSATNLQKARLKRWPGRELAHAAAASQGTTLPASAGPIQEGPGALPTNQGPSRPSPSGNQLHSGNGQPPDGESQFGRHPGSGDGQPGELPRGSGEGGEQ